MEFNFWILKKKIILSLMGEGWVRTLTREPRLQWSVLLKRFITEACFRRLVCLAACTALSPPGSKYLSGNCGWTRLGRLLLRRAHTRWTECSPWGGDGHLCAGKWCHRQEAVRGRVPSPPRGRRVGSVGWSRERPVCQSPSRSVRIKNVIVRLLTIWLHE